LTLISSYRHIVPSDTLLKNTRIKRSWF